MNIAITIWGNRISPVFDSANTLMIAQIEDSKVAHRQFKKFNPKPIHQIASTLNNFQIDVLICGAITEIQSKTIEKTGIALFSFITGNADKALVSLLKKPNQISKFLMPGSIPDISLYKNLV